MDKIWERVRYISVAVFSSAIVLFALTNLDTVQVRVIAWYFDASVSLLILVPFLAGLLIGFWSGLLRRHGVKKAKEAARVEALEEPQQLEAGPEEIVAEADIAGAEVDVEDSPEQPRL